MNSEPPEVLIEIEADGRLLALWDARLLGLAVEGRAVVRRASRILPTGRFRRFAFTLLRWTFGECGAMAQWTRQWRGPWRVDLRLSGGPANAGEFVTREEALRFERAWLIEHGLRGA